MAINIGVLEYLLQRDFLLAAGAAVAAFATIVTIGLPYLRRGQLDERMKAVAERREELRQKQREQFAQQGRRGQLRSTPVGFMKNTLDQFKLQNILESPNTKDKL